MADRMEDLEQKIFLVIGSAATVPAIFAPVSHKAAYVVRYVNLCELIRTGIPKALVAARKATNS
jgi:hypothetical protein